MHIGCGAFIRRTLVRSPSSSNAIYAANAPNSGWLPLARRVGEVKSDTGQGKNVYTGFVDHLCPGGAKSSMSPVSVAFKVIERLADADGNRLLIPRLK
jgi:hypothetical protein